MGDNKLFELWKIGQQVVKNKKHVGSLSLISNWLGFTYKQSNVVLLMLCWQRIINKLSVLDVSDVSAYRCFYAQYKWFVGHNGL